MWDRGRCDISEKKVQKNLWKSIKSWKMDLIHFIFAFIHSLPKVVVTFYLRLRNELNPFSIISLIFKAFCTFCFRYITSPPVSHLSTNYIFQNKPVKNYYYNLWKYEEYRKNNNQGRTMDENITNIAFGYGKHLWMIRRYGYYYLPTYSGSTISEISVSANF